MSSSFWLLLRQWFSGSTGLPDQPLPAARRVAVFGILFGILFLLLWPVVAGLFGNFYRDLLAQCVETVYRVLGRRFEFEYLSGETLRLISVSRPSFEADLQLYRVDSNLPFLLALVLATPGLGFWNRLKTLAIAILLLLGSHVLFVVTKVEVSLIQAGHPLAGSQALWTGMDNFLEISGKILFPIVIWISLCLPELMGWETPHTTGKTTAAVGRNSPCPCGSGKKYKHCCGK